MLYGEFIEHGHAIIPLWGAHEEDGELRCECGNVNCDAIYKHPRSSGWQHILPYDEEQLETLELAGFLDTGYGVHCRDLLVIDVDERNGGAESFDKLVENIPEILKECGLVVQTGSGGRSQHLYFYLPEDKKENIAQHLNEYKGIDFKTSGFVVGPGSKHKTGQKYAVLSGSVPEVCPPPEKLIIALSKGRKKHTVELDNTTHEITNENIDNMLTYIDPDCPHDEWYRIGMAIHHATHGDGFDLWDSWSAKGSKYPGGETIGIRWHSFGKSSTAVTIGTLIHMASENGYSFEADHEVEFVSDVDWGDVEEHDDVPKYDLTKPPGLVGRISKWINSNVAYPREHLSVAAALMVVSACGGMRYRDDIDGTCANLFSFCIAGSGTGKEAIMQLAGQLMRHAGVAQAAHGGIKSEQEIWRNIIRHQASFYTIDEMGEILSKIQGARKRSGSAPYLEGIIGALMNIYSKSNGYAAVTGDMKDEVSKGIRAEITALERKKSDNEATDMDITRLESAKKSLEEIEFGIKNPFVNLMGFTAPDRFTSLMDNDMAQSGFMARALLFREMDDNPRRQKRIKKGEDDEERTLVAILSQMYHMGHSDSARVELHGNTQVIETTERGISLLDVVYEYFWEMGENQKESEGLVPIARRGYELVSRVSLVLAMGDGIRNDEHIAWAFALVKHDIEQKIRLTHANSAPDKSDALVSKVLSHMSKTDGISLAVLKNKCRPEKSENIEKTVEHILKSGRVYEEEIKPERGRATKKYFLKQNS